MGKQNRDRERAAQNRDREGAAQNRDREGAAQNRDREGAAKRPAARGPLAHGRGSDLPDSEARIAQAPTLPANPGVTKR